MRYKFLLWGQQRIGAWYFIPLSWIYAAAVFFRNWLYDNDFLPVTRVNCVVVSVGNIVAGGMGKTPFVYMLAKRFSARKVAILSRGYGTVPDEAMMLAKKLPDAKVYVGKDRAILAKRAVDEGAELIILDDGLQHRRLHRDFEIILHDFTHRYFLPRGFLRDSPHRLKGADLVLEDLRIVPVSPPEIRGQKMGIFCGIARPERFKKMVVDLGAEIVAEWILADHEPADPTAFAVKCKELGAKALICTEKDFIKLSKTSYALPVLYLEIEVQASGSLEKLIEKIDQKIDNRCL